MQAESIPADEQGEDAGTRRGARRARTSNPRGELQVDDSQPGAHLPARGRSQIVPSARLLDRPAIGVDRQRSTTHESIAPELVGERLPGQDLDAVDDPA